MAIVLHKACEFCYVFKVNNLNIKKQFFTTDYCTAVGSVCFFTAYLQPVIL